MVISNNPKCLNPDASLLHAHTHTALFSYKNEYNILMRIILDIRPHNCRRVKTRLANGRQENKSMRVQVDLLRKLSGEANDSLPLGLYIKCNTLIVPLNYNSESLFSFCKCLIALIYSLHKTLMPSFFMKYLPLVKRNIVLINCFI